MKPPEHSRSFLGPYSALNQRLACLCYLLRCLIVAHSLLVRTMKAFFLPSGRGSSGGHESVEESALIINCTKHRLLEQSLLPPRHCPQIRRTLLTTLRHQQSSLLRQAAKHNSKKFSLHSLFFHFSCAIIGFRFWFARLVRTYYAAAKKAVEPSVEPEMKP